MGHEVSSALGTGWEDPSMLRGGRKIGRKEDERDLSGEEWGRGRHGVLVISYILSYFGGGTKVEDFVLYERKSWKGDIATGTTIFDLSE